MARLSQASQPNSKSKTKKRVSFAPNQPTECTPQTYRKEKAVRFTKGTKPGSRSDSKSAASSKTRWPSSHQSTPPAPKVGVTGLSSVRRDFETKKKPSLKTASRPAETSKASKPSKVGRPDARVSIPVHGKSFDGPPKAKHQRSGYEWVSYEIRVKPTGKDWKRKKQSA